MSAPVTVALPKSAIIVHAIGQLLAREGKRADAILHYRQTLARLAGDHPQIASVRTALGLLLLEDGEPAEALSHLQEALARKSEAISQGHPFVAFTWFEVGAALIALGRAAEADDAFARALAVFERRLGLTHPRTVAAHLERARLAFDAGRTADARAHAERVVASAGTASADPRAIASAQVILAQIATHEGRIDDAIEALRPAVAALASALGAHDPEVLARLHDLGRAHLRRGDLDAALAAFVQAIEGHRAAMSTETEGAAAILNAIGQVLYNQGKYKPALAHYHQALSIRQRLLGATHPQTVTTQFNCGTAMRQLGDPFGLAEMESAAETLEELLGPNHPHAQALRAWLR